MTDEDDDFPSLCRMKQHSILEANTARVISKMIDSATNGELNTKSSGNNPRGVTSAGLLEISTSTTRSTRS